MCSAVFIRIQHRPGLMPAPMYRQYRAARSEADRIFMPEQEMGSEYTVITAFSLADPQDQTDSRAVFGSAGLCYVSGENIYVTESCYDTDDSDVTRTAIRKVAYHDGLLEGAAQTKIDGLLNDSFSIDEYNGYLRLVTTISSENGVMPISRESSPAEPDTSNALYVLDGELQLVGEIGDLAPGETVYSGTLHGRYRILCHIPAGGPAVLRRSVRPGVPADHRGAEDTGLFGISPPLWRGTASRHRDGCG